MNLATPFVQRPVASFLIAMAILLLGVMAYQKMPIAPLPQVDIPTIEVSASLPGASPESMAATVATPLERAMNGLSGVKAINSSSSQGATSIQVDFELGRDINEAAREVQAAIHAVSGQLPSGMPQPPSYQKINPSQAPILELALSSENLAASELYDAASTLVAQRIAQIKGVSTVEIGGGSLPAIRVKINPQALAQQGISLEQVRQAIESSNVTQRLGLIEQAQYRWQIQLNAALNSPDEFGNIIVRHTAAGLVRLRDVAEVSHSVESRYATGFHNHQAAVILTIRRQPHANIVATIDAIQQELPYLQGIIPADSKLTVVLDRAKGIRAALYESQLTLGIAAVLVIAVVYLFLGQWRSALIPAVTIPVAIIGAFGLMYLCDFSLNTLSVLALIIAISLVVDDAIVVLENIERHLQAGLNPLQAAVQGVREVGFTLVAMNLALLVIFVSILFMGGVIERLFQEFSITLVMVMLLSLFFSLTLTPSLCAYCLKPQTSKQPKGLAGISQQLQVDIQRVYQVSLSWLLRHGYLAVIVWVGIIGASFYLFKALPQNVLQEQDTGQLEGFVRGDDGFSFQIMQPKIEAYRRYILQDPAVADVVGVSGGEIGTTNAILSISLKPLSERKVSATEVANRLRTHAPKIPGGVFMVDVQQDIELQDPFAGASNDHRLLLQSDDMPILRQWAPVVAKKMETLPQLEYVSTIGDEGAQQVVLDIDREAAMRLGVSMQDIASLLNNSFSQRPISTRYEAMNQYRVVMEVDRRFTEQPAMLASIQVINQQGRSIPLSSFTTWRYGIVSDRVHHRNQYAAVGIEYTVAAGYSATEADQAIRAMLPSLLLPSRIFVATERDIEAENLQSTLSTPVLLLLVILVVYLLLGVLYESIWHPFTILSTIPSASIGAFLILWMTKTDFSLIALLGLFLLTGIVLKNAILMIDFAIVARRQGQTAEDAIFQAASLRLRPILMTNLAGLLGALPLALGLGDGSEIRRPLGLVIVGGLALSQFITLYTTPVIYLYFERLQQRWSKKTIALTAPAPSSLEQL